MPLTIVLNSYLIVSTNNLPVSFINLTTLSHCLPQPSTFVTQTVMTAIRAVIPATIQVTGQPHREAFKSHCTPVHATVAAFTAPAHTVCSFSALVTKPIALPNSPNRGKSCETVTACCAMIVA